MEHIIQFGITIDDDAIEKRVMQSATNEVVKEIKDKIFSKCCGHYDGLSPETKEIVKQFLEDNKDAIIKNATDIIVDSIRKSKKYKEALTTCVEVIENDR